MDSVQQILNSYMMPNLPYILLLMIVIMTISLVVFIVINIKLSRLNRKYLQMMNGVEGKNLEESLFDHMTAMREGVNKIESLSAYCKNLNEKNKKAVQKVGVVRFNAFSNTGSDLSFAVALLDDHDNGVVFCSLFGRSESRVYAKPISKGESSYLLTAEEKEALQKAKESV